VSWRAALAVGACAATALAGCGGGGSATTSFTGPDPATLTPADVPLFNEAVVRPEGDQKAALDSALSKLLATDDPSGFIVERLDQALADQDAGITYERDIAPWLGPRIGVFVETFSEHAQAAVLLSTTDPAASQEAIDKVASATNGPERKRAYRGFDYLVFSRDDSVAGIVGDFVVGGSEQAFKDAVDASRGGSLAGSEEFSSQLKAAPDDQLYFAYADPRAIVDSLEKSGRLSAGEVHDAGSQVQSLLSQPATASLSATADDLALELSVAHGPATATVRESELLKGFPSDSWLAFASADAGPAIGQGVGAAAQEALGFDLGSQLEDWAGDVGGFVSGTSLFGIGGALVVETNDDQASAQTLDDLQERLSRIPEVRISPLSTGGEQGFSLTPSGTPIQVQFVQRDGKVVVGLGSDSVDQVLSPDSTLDDSEAFKSATDALEGFSPVTFVGFVPLFQLVESFPQVAEDPDYQRAKPYLDHLDFLVIGGRSEGDRDSIRVVLGLRDAPNGGDSQATNAAVSPAP
jgi:hypothetical protein